MSMTRLTKPIKRITNVKAQENRAASGNLCVALLPAGDGAIERVRTWVYGTSQGYELSVRELHAFMAKVSADRAEADRRTQGIASHARRSVKRFGCLGG